MKHIFEVEHVNFAYHSMQGEIPALSDITFSVNPGEFIAVVGPSGCGKGMAQPEKQFFTFPAAGCPEHARSTLPVLSVCPDTLFFLTRTLMQKVCQKTKVSAQGHKPSPRSFPVFSLFPCLIYRYIFYTLLPAFRFPLPPDV